MRTAQTFFLMLCLVLSAALCHAHGVAGTENVKDGIPIDIKEATCYGGLEKDNSILASIDGHVLSVVFTENLGEVAIDITTSAGYHKNSGNILR